MINLPFDSAMLNFHPAIRIVSFVVLTAFLALGGATNTLIGAAVLFLLYARFDAPARRSAWRMLRRMRWLFLSITVIYLWFTPGLPLIPGATTLGAWLPSVDGLRQGGVRVASLALIVAAASLLLHVTSQEQMLGALRWLLAPLRYLGFPHERFAVRAALTLAAVSRVQGLVRQALASAQDTARSWDRIGAVAAAVFAVALREAEAAPCLAIELSEQAPPPLVQWGAPLLLMAVMAAA